MKHTHTASSGLLDITPNNMKEAEILSNIQARMGIEELNEMQQAMIKHCSGAASDITLLSPTGSGKTLAFLIPTLKAMGEADGKLQALIIAPSRELVIQIYEIARQIATPYKVSCCYGGHNVLDEKQSLKATPALLITTPGRLVDHIQRGHIDIYSTRLLVLDEFDKTLELGFHEEVRKIIKHAPNVKRKILTSATMIAEYPDFIRQQSPVIVNFLYNNAQTRSRMKVWRVQSPDKDKLETLRHLLLSLPVKKTIVFVNYRDAVERVQQFLKQSGISAGIYHGALEQIEREKAIAMFNNGSYTVLVSTDLGSRGLDIDSVGYIVHYHLPVSAQAYTHRNGRTARVDEDGEVFVITAPGEQLPEGATTDDDKAVDGSTHLQERITAPCQTLYFMAGKKEKISKGDILGFLLANTSLTSPQIGKIDVKDHYALVALPEDVAAQALQDVATKKIKNKKIKISFAKVS